MVFAKSPDIGKVCVVVLAFINVSRLMEVAAACASPHQSEKQFNISDFSLGTLESLHSGLTWLYCKLLSA